MDKSNVINFAEAAEKQAEVEKNENLIITDEGFESENVDLTFKIENFEGPLDLLLHLIKKSKLEIEEVKLSEITEQYLKIMDQIENVDLEVASEFIEVAATLIEIKSKALLPRLELIDEDEEDPEALLLQRLAEYKLFKETIEKIKPLEDVDRYYKDPEPDAHKFRIVLKDMDMEMLVNAFTGIFHRVRDVEAKATPKEVVKEQFTVSGKVAAIKDALVLKKTVMFSNLFESSSSRDEVITTFLAILELLKLQEIKVKQNDVFSDIEIIKAEQE